MSFYLLKEVCEVIDGFRTEDGECEAELGVSYSLAWFKEGKVALTRTEWYYSNEYDGGNGAIDKVGHNRVVFDKSATLNDYVNMLTIVANNQLALSHELPSYSKIHFEPVY